MDDFSVLVNYALIFALLYVLSGLNRDHVLTRQHLSHAMFWQRHFRHLTVCMTHEVVRNFYEYREKNGVPFDNYVVTMSDKGIAVTLFLNDEKVDVEVDTDEDFWLALTSAADQLSS